MYIVNSSKSYAQVIALLNIKITVHTLRTIYPQSINNWYIFCLAELASIARTHCLGRPFQTHFWECCYWSVSWSFFSRPISISWFMTLSHLST